MAQVALVTGASLGIGRAFAEVLAENKCDLVLVARSEDKLNDLAKTLRSDHGVNVHVIAKDLSELRSIEALVAELTEKKIKIDYLVNNAGFGLLGFFTETDWEAEHRMIELNITALTYLTKIFAREMTKRGSGRILNVASTAAFQPGPKMAVYFATKAYVLSLTEALANELQGSGVTITALCPGPTESGFQTAAKIKDEPLFNRMKPASSEEVARFGYGAMMKGETIAVHGLLNKIGAKTVGFFPRKMVAGMVRKMTES